MTRTSSIANAAWGLELTSGAAVLVRVARNGAALRVDRRQTFDAGDFFNSGALDSKLLGALSNIPRDEPLGVSFPDQSMLCRGFSLPRSKPAAMEKMVQAQGEALLPIGDDRLRWTWQDFPDPLNPAMQWVVLCAARREVIDRLRSAIPEGVQLRVLTPRILAAVDAPAINGSALGSEVLIDVTDESATLGLRVQGKLLRCLVMDRNGDEPDPQAGSPWLRQSRLTFRSLLEGVPRERRPVSALRIGGVRSEGVPSVASTELAEALGLKFNGEMPTCDAAFGAARMALDEALQTINFARQRDHVAEPKPVRPRRAIALAAACLAGILLWYGIDVWRARWLSRQFEQLRAAETSSGGIERRLAIDRYLEKNASVALPGLDAILAAAPPSLNMTSFGVSTAGQFRLVGELRNPSELDPFLRKLQESRALTNVQLRSARGDEQRWSLELTADAAPMAGLLLAAPKPAEKIASPRVVPASTAPATQPATRGAR